MAKTRLNNILSYFGLTPTDFSPTHLSEVQDASKNNLTHRPQVQVNGPTHSSEVRVPIDNGSLPLGNKRKLVTDAATGFKLGRTNLPQGNIMSQSVPLEGSREPVNPILHAGNAAQSQRVLTDYLRKGILKTMAASLLR